MSSWSATSDTKDETFVNVKEEILKGRGKRHSVKIASGALFLVSEESSVRNSINSIKRLSSDESVDVLLCMLCVWQHDSPQFVNELRGQIEFFTQQLNDPNANDIPMELDKSRKWTVDEVNQIFNLLTSPGPQRYRWIRRYHPWFSELDPIKQEKAGHQIIELMKKNAGEGDYEKLRIQLTQDDPRSRSSSTSTKSSEKQPLLEKSRENEVEKKSGCCVVI